MDIIFPILFTVCNLTLWTLYTQQILEDSKGREKKADWPETLSPKELHGGDYMVGCLFTSYIPQLELRKLATQKQTNTTVIKSFSFQQKV